MCVFFYYHTRLKKQKTQYNNNLIFNKMCKVNDEKSSLFSAVSENVTTAAILERRFPKKDGTFPVIIRVNYKRERWHHRTGVSLSIKDYIKILNLKSNTGDYYKIKQEINTVFQKITEAIKQLNADKKFSFDNLQKAIANPEAKCSVTLFEYWTQFGESKNTEKTREQYRQALRNFYRSLGCKITLEKDPKDPKQKTIIYKGAKMKIAPTLVDEKLIANWVKYMDENGLSDSTKSIYLRALRAVMNSLGQANLISEMPKFTIKAGTRRKEDFISVPDIIKIRDYQGSAKKYADWWIIIYLCNGSNLKDLAKMVWNDDYFFHNELSFVRGKIADKVKVTVHIPITEALKTYLDKYASEPKQGQLVFPQIMLNAETEVQQESRVHDFNRSIRRGMQTVCKELGIQEVTASTARNSYITALTWHGISDAFIDSMVGHVDNKNVLRGYQGTISPKKRMKVNNLLFEDPEIEDDND